MLKSKTQTKTKKLHMIGNAHIDPVWLWQWPEGFHEVHATFKSALDRMKENEDFQFISSAAIYYEWIERTDPAMFTEIQQRVAEGRWGIVGGWYVQPDCNIPSGESFARHGLYSQRYFMDKFGKMAETGYNVDSFGHNAMLPQILRKSGMKNYIFMRPSPHEKGLPARLFWWESDDGSRVLAYRLPYEYCSWPNDIEKHVRRCAEEIKGSASESMAFYGVGNHGGGPTKENLACIARLNEKDDLPELVYSQPEDYFRSMLESGAFIPTVHDDLQHHGSGCYAAHSGVKRWNRQAENTLLAAEKMASIALQVTGTPVREDFKQAWKQVMFNQFHDILAGTSLEIAYEDARSMYGEAFSIAGRALNDAVQALSWNIDIEEEAGCKPFVVFNPHAWPVRTNIELEVGLLKDDDVLLDPQGKQISYQRVQSVAAANGRWRISFMAELPAMGYVTYRLLPGQAKSNGAGLEASDTVLENARLRLEIDPETGWIKSLKDKKRNIEVLAGPAARPVVIDDPTDTWGHNLFTFNDVVGEFKAKRARLVEHGPVKAVIHVESEWGASKLTQDFTMYYKGEQIEVKATLDWREQRKMLKLRFPLNLQFMRATAEIPYGHIEKFANGEEEPCQSWIDLSGVSRADFDTYGVSILNDSKYSYDVNIRDVGLTITRSPIYVHHMPVEPQADKDYVYMDQGIQHFTYTILLHEGGWEQAGTVRRAAELNQPAIVLPATFHAGELPQIDSFAEINAENIIVTAIKQAEDGDGLIVRAYETNELAVDADIRLLAWGRTIQAHFDPCEIKTFKVPKDTKTPIQEVNLLEWQE